MASGTVERQVPENGVSVETARATRTYRPPVDIIERGDELMILADMPGVPADQLEIQFEDGMLTIHGHVPRRQDESVRYLMQEYGEGDFYRSFQVSEAVDPTRITAELSCGVLTLHLPKVDAIKPRKIEVKVQ